jgi:5-methylcytosine-specific restriction endonuclease McrA
VPQAVYDGGMTFLKRHKSLRRKTPLRKVSARQKTILELDMLAKAVVIERDGKGCLRCGRTDQIQSSHIFPKGKYPKLRFDIDNLKLLCMPCHIFWWHRDIQAAADWIRTAIPQERYDRLLKRVMYVDRSPLDLKLIELELKELLRRYKAHNTS